VKSMDLETKVKQLEAQQKKSKLIIKQLEARITQAEDIEAIKKLQRAYGFYLEHWQEDELMISFLNGMMSPSKSMIAASSEGRRRQKMLCFRRPLYCLLRAETAPPEYLHLMVPISGIVDVDPDGKTAKGRWYGTFHGALPRGGILRALVGYGIWEMDYIKEDEVWKIWKLLFCDIFSSPVEDGWVKTPFINNPPAKERPAPMRGKDIKPYPSGYIFPYHYKNPVSGK